MDPLKDLGTSSGLKKLTYQFNYIQCSPCSEYQTKEEVGGWSHP